MVRMENQGVQENQARMVDPEMMVTQGNLETMDHLVYLASLGLKVKREIWEDQTTQVKIIKKQHNN